MLCRIISMSHFWPCRSRQCLDSQRQAVYSSTWWDWRWTELFYHLCKADLGSIQITTTTKRPYHYDALNICQKQHGHIPECLFLRCAEFCCFSDFFSLFSSSMQKTASQRRKTAASLPQEQKSRSWNRLVIHHKLLLTSDNMRVILKLQRSLKQSLSQPASSAMHLSRYLVTALSRSWLSLSQA